MKHVNHSVEHQTHHPLTGYTPDLLRKFGASTAIGQSVRKGDAKKRLQEMENAEAEISAQEENLMGITSRLNRLSAEHAWEMQYLIRFGVKASERAAFREILEEVSLHGGLTLREAATLAGARSMSAKAVECHC